MKIITQPFTCFVQSAVSAYNHDQCGARYAVPSVGPASIA